MTPAMIEIEESAFPKLTDSEIAMLRPLATAHDYADGEIVFRVGQANIDLCVVESGQLDILNPANGNSLVATHEAGGFAGDIDLLTGRPVIVNAVARGATRILRVPGNHFPTLLNRVSSLGERLIIAITRRRELLTKAGALGLKVVGPGRCKDTNVVREFLYKNFVPFTWYDPATEAGQAVFVALGSPRKTPVIECGNGDILINPTLRELAKSAGIWRECPVRDVDLAIVGAGPAGITAAVYAASEGLSTVVLDRLGPGGQAGGSSRIENFIGFPAGLSGAELATRGVLQMLKFGARMVAPITVEQLTPLGTGDEGHELRLDCGTKIRSRVVLLAAGVRWRRLEAAGAERFDGAGIYYACTTVEADLYDKQDVVVVGGGNSAGQAAMFLAECCPSRKVHMLVRRTLSIGLSEYLTSRIKATGNIVVQEHTEIEAVRGGGHRIEAVELRNNRTNERHNLACGAVFVFIGAEPACDWLPSEIARDSNGYLLTGTEVIRSGRWPRTDRDPCPLETTVPGILVAGDLRSGSTKRVGFAVGDGALAVTCAHRLLSLGAKA